MDFLPVKLIDIIYGHPANKGRLIVYILQTRHGVLKVLKKGENNMRFLLLILSMYFIPSQAMSTAQKCNDIRVNVFSCTPKEKKESSIKLIDIFLSDCDLDLQRLKTVKTVFEIIKNSGKWEARTLHIGESGKNPAALLWNGSYQIKGDELTYFINYINPTQATLMKYVPTTNGNFNLIEQSTLPEHTKENFSCAPTAVFSE